MNRLSPLRIICLLIVVTAIDPSGAQAETAQAREKRIEQRFAQVWNIFAPCTGECAVLVNAGPWLDRGLPVAFGVDGFVAGPTFENADTGILAVSVSRPLVTIRDRVDIAPEVGVAKRFGDSDSEEVWASLNVRVRSFPWDHVVRTTAAFGIGANYAFRLDPLEDAVDPDSGLEHLLVYLAPEITLGLPKYPNADLVLRIHHRSGGERYLLRELWGSQEGGAAQFITAGLRWRF
jgi:hypothetical protein